MSKRGFLASIEKGPRERLRAAMTIQNYDRNSLVISHKDQTDDVYFVLIGRARATIFSENGKMVSLREIGPGEVFGELAAIDLSLRSASVSALEPLTIGHLSGAKFRAMIETEPALMWATMRYLTEQVRRMTERVFEFSTLLARDRLAAELVRLARAAAPDASTAVLSPAPTHFELAASISTHREEVSRQMSKLSKLNLIRTENRKLHFLDIEGLEALVKTH